MESDGVNAATMTAGRTAIQFAEQNRPRLVHASENVRIEQQSSPEGKQPQKIEITSQGARTCISVRAASLPMPRAMGRRR